MNPLLKIGLSALLIFIITVIAKRYTFAGAVVASLPVISLLSMIWLYRDTQDVEKIARFSQNVFWLVIPSLVLFAGMPLLLLKFRLGFYMSLGLSSLATVAAYFLMTLILRKFDIAT